MQEESLSDHELTPVSVWATTKINFYEEEQESGLPFIPAPRWREPKQPKIIAELPPPPPKAIFAKDDQRALRGRYMEITLGRILFNLHVIAGRDNEQSVVSLVELRYQNTCKFNQPIPTVIMTDSRGVPTSGRSFNEISLIVLKDQQVPIWFQSPAQLLEAEGQTTGWVVFDRLARDFNDVEVGHDAIVIPRHLRLALVLYEVPGQTGSRIKGEEIFEFNIK